MLMCGVNPGAHEAQERTQAPLQTNLISYSSHAEAPKEWFYYPEASQPPSSPTEGHNPLPPPSPLYPQLLMHSMPLCCLALLQQP